MITVGAKEENFVRELEALGKVQDSDVPYSISSGYSFVDRSEENAVDQAFSRADAMMYANKMHKLKNSV